MNRKWFYNRQNQFKTICFLYIMRLYNILIAKKLHFEILAASQPQRKLLFHKMTIIFPFNLVP